MKIKDIIEKLDKSEDNSEWVDAERFYPEVNVVDLFYVNHDKLQERLKCYWVAKRMCTDTHVGLRAYFLDGKFVCMSHQSGRKCDEEFEWISKEAFLSVKNYLFSLVENEVHTPETIDMEEDLGEFYPIDFSGQFLRKEVKYKGADVLIVKQSYSYTDMDSVTIKKKCGQEFVVSAKDIETPWNIIK